ncbi:MAG: ABC transporter permease [Defluviitaleaceae bacterium]|nr:ABC transporter permease [Defluviitaleaceae bacterium]
MNQLLTVLKFEYLTFVKSKSFVIITAIMLVLAFAAPSVPSVINFFSNNETFGEQDADKIALLDISGVFTPEICNVYMPGYSFELFGSLQAAQNAVTDGTHKFALFIDDFNYTLFVSSMSLTQFILQDSVQAMISRVYLLTCLENAGLQTDEAAGILAFSPSGSIVALASPSGEDTSENYQENLIYAYIMLFVIYFGLIMYGQYVLVSVVREKSTKTMEMLITSCKSIWLINGKVLGVGLAGLTQLSLLAVAALASMYLNSKGLSANPELFTVAIKPDIIALMVVLFLLCFFSLAYVYAALASTVSRMEDANSIAFFPMIMIMIGFFAAMGGMTDPGAGWVTVCSFVPFISPMVMFMRICMGTAAALDVVLCVAVQLVTIFFMAALGAKIYRLGTLMYGKKPNPKEVFGLLVKK